METNNLKSRRAMVPKTGLEYTLRHNRKFTDGDLLKSVNEYNYHLCTLYSITTR